jgi:hypothetical protein
VKLLKGKQQRKSYSQWGEEKPKHTRSSYKKEKKE